MESTPTILVADDDPAILEGLVALFEGEGIRVVAARDGMEALKHYHDHTLSLLLLDVVMPEFSGLEVCRHVRLTDPAVPIIMLTAKTSESDKVLGLEIGADDYIVKPFGTQELVARVRAALRRRSVANPMGAFEYDDLRINFDRREVEHREGLIQLTAKEFDLLAYLVQRRGVAIERQELLRHVWQYGHEDLIDTRTVDIHIMRLRKKLEPDISEPRYIVTVRGAGYMFEYRQ